MSLFSGCNVNIYNSHLINTEGNFYSNHVDDTNTDERLARRLKASLETHLLDFMNVNACTEGTRVQVLQEIQHWINIDSPANSNPHQAHFTRPFQPDSPSILWLTGAAGTGKTAIAATIARSCRERRILGASFFVSRFDSSRANPKSIIPAIACGLAQRNPIFGDKFVKKLEDYCGPGGLLERDAIFQINTLIITPLHEHLSGGNATGSSAIHPGPCVVLIDALDECQRDDESRPKEETVKIVTAILENIKDLTPVRFIITCRPEHRFLDLMRTHKEAITSLELHDKRWMTEADIESYFRREFETKLEYLGPDWVSEDNIIRLTRYSQNLFIIAKTCMGYITDEIEGNPEDRLSALLELIQNHDTSSFTSFTPESSPEPTSSLDKLYEVILNRTPPYTDRRMVSMMSVLGTIVLWQLPLCARALDKLLGYHQYDGRHSRNALEGLRSVVIIPDDDAEDNEMKLLHLSFGDYITDSTRCNPKFLVDVRRQHEFLAERCLKIWETEMHGERRGEVDPTLSHSVTAEKSHIRYAAQFWGDHLRGGSHPISPSIHAKLLRLCSSEYILYWIEFCARRGILRSALASIHSVARFIEQQNNAMRGDADLCERLRQAEQWIRQYFSLLEEAPQQVYHIPFSPPLLDVKELDNSSSWIRELAFHRNEDLSKIWQIEMASTARSCVTFMHGDDEFILAATSGSLEIWDMLSGTQVGALNGEEKFTSVAVSEDGKTAASGSRKGVVQIWDLTSGVCERLMEKHIHPGLITTVAFSPVTKRRVVSGDAEGNLVVWDVEGRSATRKTNLRHESEIATISFSADGCLVLSLSRFDQVLCIWDPDTGRERIICHIPANVSAAAFSPPRENSSRTMVCGTSDGVFRLWKDGTGGLHWLSQPYPDSSINTLSFSPNGSQIISLIDGDQQPLRILLFELDGGSSRCIVCPEFGIESLVFARDGKHIVTSDPQQGRIRARVWKQHPSLEAETIDICSSPVACTLFSPRGDMFAIGFQSGSIMLWSLINGVARKLPDFENLVAGARVLVAAFSAGGTMLGIGLEVTNADKTHSPPAKAGAIYLSNVVNHSQVDTKLRILWRSRAVDKLVFCPINEHVIACSSADSSEVEIWDLGKEAVTSTLHGTHNPVNALNDLIFSPDGTKIATACRDNVIAIWDITSGACLGTLGFNRGRAESISFTSDGRGFIAMTVSRAVGLFDMKCSLVKLVPGGAVVTQRGIEPTGRLVDLVATLDRFCGFNLVGMGSARRGDFSRYNSGKLTSFLANLDRSSRRPGEKPEMITEDGWLWCLVRRRRIMPIPKSLRVDPDRGLAHMGDYVVLVTDKGQIHILDISRMLQELDRVDAKL